MNFKTLQRKVIAWADEKGILRKGTLLAQVEKTREEVEEIRDAILLLEELNADDYGPALTERRNKLREEFDDAIGDTIVTLIILAQMRGSNALECLEGAYNVIKHRKGEMIAGAFVKEGGEK